MPPQEKKKKKQKREKKKTPLSRQLATPSPTLLQLSSAEKKRKPRDEQVSNSTPFPATTYFLPLPTSFK